MSIPRWFRSPRIRKGLAASVIVLCAGGLILARSSAHADPTVLVAEPEGRNAARFSGPGVTGALSLSHEKLLAGESQRFFAELTMRATASDVAPERAPLSLVVVLDTSGSMSGDKIERAKQSVIQLLEDMRSEDEIALVRYSHEPVLMQPLSRVGEVRSSLISRIEEIQASGGTNIPRALSMGLENLEDVRRGRAKRVVLVSDGLDSTRERAQGLARTALDRQITVSSLGIGLDFDESYMSGVARAGRGNFAFVRNPSALAKFLKRELKETASTTVEGALAKLTLPRGVQFERAVGADARTVRGGREVELRLGSLFAGDERRVVVELSADVDSGESLSLTADASWTQVGGDTTDVRIPGLRVVGSTDRDAVAEARDGRVFASCVSALASLRQLEAAEAYRKGDRTRALTLIDQNMDDLKGAAVDAPAPMAGSLAKQNEAYQKTKKDFGAAPESAPGRAAAKAAAESETGNLSRKAY